MAKQIKEAGKSIWKSKTDKSGQRIMICQNSQPGGRWWKKNLCNEWTIVSEKATAVLCSRCVQQVVEPPVERGSTIKSDKPKGWKFMRLFVATDGTVFHKGVEQTDLKGTLPVTVITPKVEKVKMSPQEKQDAILALGKEIKNLKAELIYETRKGKRAELARNLTKASRQLNKLM